MLKTKVPILAEFRVPESRVFLVKPSIKYNSIVEKKLKCVTLMIVNVFT